MVDQRFIREHAHVGRDVVPLGLADQRVEASAGVVAVSQQHLEPIDKSVFVGTVQRVARLKGDDAVPTLGGQ